MKKVQKTSKFKPQWRKQLKFSMSVAVGHIASKYCKNTELDIESKTYLFLIYCTLQHHSILYFPDESVTVHNEQYNFLDLKEMNNNLCQYISIVMHECKIKIIKIILICTHVVIYECKYIAFPKIQGMNNIISFAIYQCKYIQHFLEFKEMNHNRYEYIFSYI